MNFHGNFPTWEEIPAPDTGFFGNAWDTLTKGAIRAIGNLVFSEEVALFVFNNILMNIVNGVVIPIANWIFTIAL